MKSTVSIADLEAKVQSLVRPERMEHIRRVAELAREIARNNGLDPERAYLAGLLHDAARDLPEEELRRLAPRRTRWRRPTPRPPRAGGPGLGRLLGVRDEEVLEAIEGHVYGVDPENGIGMALYVADVSEPGRGVNEEIRELALAGRLKEAYRLAVRNKVHYLKAKKIPIHPRTLEVYHSL